MRNAANGIDLAKLSAFGRQHPEIERLEIFGSHARGDALAESDLDVLVTFRSNAAVSLFDLCGFREELAQEIGCAVDLMTRSSIEQSRNPIRKRHILGQAVTVYGA
jgi:predicted nucleotidyltransferase